MKVLVADWMCGPNLKGTKYQNEDPKKNGVELDGDVDLAFKIARELYDLGRNVKVVHWEPKNVGTKKNPKWTEDTIMVTVDDKNFTQR